MLILGPSSHITTLCGSLGKSSGGGMSIMGFIFLVSYSNGVCVCGMHGDDYVVKKDINKKKKI